MAGDNCIRKAMPISSTSLQRAWQERRRDAGGIPVLSWVGDIMTGKAVGLILDRSITMDLNP
jgi:hypothetical protein